MARCRRRRDARARGSVRRQRAGAHRPRRRRRRRRRGRRGARRAREPRRVVLGRDERRSSAAACWRGSAARCSSNVELLARLEALDVGKPLKQARADAVALARYLEFYGGAADKVHGETLPFAAGYTALTLREPHGVTGHIVPWNYPMQIVGRSVGAALAMGNACVLKPAEEACLTVLAFARICAEAGLPAGALNVVTGLGEEAGAALAAHPGVDHVSFTGSVATGALIQTAAARNAVPVTLELGGKSPQIVFADADLDAALPFLVNAGIQNAGQTCSAASRILVERPVFDDGARDAWPSATARCASARRCDDLDVGPLISAPPEATASTRFLALARDGGLRHRRARASSSPTRRAAATTCAPTLVADVPADHALAQEEIFGPVQVLIAFDDEAEAIAHRQRHRLRPRRRRLDARRRPRAAHGAGAAVRPGLRQQLRRRRRHRAAVRRRQALGPRPREGLRGALRLLDAEDRRDPPRLTSGPAGHDSEHSMRLQGKIAIVTGGGVGLRRGHRAASSSPRARRSSSPTATATAPRAPRRASARRPRGVRVDVADGRRRRGDGRRRRERTSAASTSSSTTPAWATCRSRWRTLAEADFDRILAVNVKSIYLAARGGRAALQGAAGAASILNIASTAGVSPRPRLTWYNASKGWVITATRVDGGRARAVRHPRRARSTRSPARRRC